MAIVTMEYQLELELVCMLSTEWCYLSPMTLCDC